MLHRAPFCPGTQTIWWEVKRRNENDFLGTCTCAYKPVPELHELAGLTPVVNCWLCYSVTLAVTCKMCNSPVSPSYSLDISSCIHAVKRLKKSWLHQVGIFILILWYVTLLTKPIKVKPMFNSFILKNITLSLEELCRVPSASGPSFHVLVEDLSWQCFQAISVDVSLFCTEISFWNKLKGLTPHADCKASSSELACRLSWVGDTCPVHTSKVSCNQHNGYAFSSWKAIWIH